MHVIQYLYATILCSVGRFEKKLIILSVLVSLRYISISIHVSMSCKPKKLICPLSSYVGLNLMLVCMWCMLEVMRSA